jgi:hypothetical protein
MIGTWVHWSWCLEWVQNIQKNKCALIFQCKPVFLHTFITSLMSPNVTMMNNAGVKKMTFLYVYQWNKIASDVLCDSTQTLLRHYVNIILLMPVRKVQPSLCQFSQNCKYSTVLCADLLYRFHSYRVVDVESMDRSSYTSLSAVWLSLC